jgi:putative transposase
MEGHNLGILSSEQIRGLIKEHDLKDASDIETMLKTMFADTIKEMLESEMDHELGYSKYDYKNKETDNSRNGYSKKKIRSKSGEINLAIPRDRNGEFEPVVVKKHERNISSIEDRIISMYAKGMSTRDIQKHLHEIYGFEASPTLISNITDKILPLITEWQNRPLEPIYTVVFLDAINHKVRHNHQIVNTAAYIAIGVDITGRKDVLGIWIGESESAKFWLNVLNELHNRGIEDILIICVDNLTGFSQAIGTVFPDAKIQKCIVHQIRNSFRYIPRKHSAEFIQDLRAIYQAPSESEGLRNLDILEEKWADRYNLAVKAWRTNWNELSTFYDYPAVLRKLIYTTNIIEAFNRQLRKVTKSKSVFTNDQSLFKILYLVTMDVTESWTRSVLNWASVLAQLSIIFGDRLNKYLI